MIFHLSTRAMGLIYVSLSARSLPFTVVLFFHLGYHWQESGIFRAHVDFVNPNGRHSEKQTQIRCFGYCREQCILLFLVTLSNCKFNLVRLVSRLSKIAEVWTLDFKTASVCRHCTLSMPPPCLRKPAQLLWAWKTPKPKFSVFSQCWKICDAHISLLKTSLLSEKQKNLHL